MSMQIDYNSVASFERGKSAQSRTRGTHTFTAVLLAIFFVVLMCGMAAGVAMYQSVANNQLDTNKARMQAGLLASNVRANDAANALGTGNGPEGRALVLTERDADGGAYEARIYLYQGNIVQEYSIAGAAYTPERAQPLIKSNTFDFELHGELLVIRTDQGATNIALRSHQGGAS
ncbi:MAG: DUF4860 domain-containing protein [Eggerthellaceae bacterium]|nr:DUF4860 domain-containing protein [Eggerthellaceae bacterium]